MRRQGGFTNVAMGLFFPGYKLEATDLDNNFYEIHDQLQAMTGWFR